MNVHRIVEPHLQSDERVAWEGTSRTRSYALRYVPGNVLGLFFACMVLKLQILDSPGPPSLFAWGLLAIALLASLAGLLGIWRELDVHWVVTDRAVLRVRRDGVRRIPAADIEGAEASGDEVRLRIACSRVPDGDPAMIDMRALADPTGALTAVERVLSCR